MSFLPISINVENKKLLIVGGGKVALQKIKNIIPFTKNITVVAPEIHEDITKIDGIATIFDSYKKEYLNGMFLVYACSNSPEVNQQVLKDAESSGILCNRTDQSGESHFHSPGIVQTDDLVVAVNSRRKEVKKMVELRDEISGHLRERENLLKQKEGQKSRVYLVGFGPGNPDLITCRGEKLLFQADVIFYDDLLDAQALDRYTAEKVYVGKRRGNHSKEQNEINEVLYKAALDGKVVVRLKGGDPLIFGRGSEERFYLENRGIKVEVVPGISSAIAAAAYGDIPLTHRGISSSVAFGTAHGKNSYRILESDTSVYFMGARNVQQIAQKYLDKGYSPDYPVALVHNASLENQEVIKTTISELAKGEMNIKSPLISVFGNTVNYRKIIMDKEKEEEMNRIPG